MRNLKGDVLQEESKKLIKYFMAALTVPEDEVRVNLSSHEIVQTKYSPKHIE